MIPEILAEVGVIGPLGAAVELLAVFFLGKVLYDHLYKK